MALLLTTASGLFLLSQTASAKTGFIAAILIGSSMGGESDVTPYLLARYFGMRHLATLYGFTWTAYAIAAALGSVLLGHAFDSSGSYAPLLVRFSLATFGAALLMFVMPRYPVEVFTRRSKKQRPEPLQSLRKVCQNVLGPSYRFSKVARCRQLFNASTDFLTGSIVTCLLPSYGDPNAVMPNIERLAQQGVQFTNSYCTTPSCSATAPLF